MGDHRRGTTSFNPSKESTAVLTEASEAVLSGPSEFQPLKGINGRTDHHVFHPPRGVGPRFNPSKESTAVLTKIRIVTLLVATVFQPLKGINGRTDPAMELNRKGCLGFNPSKESTAVLTIGGHRFGGHGGFRFNPSKESTAVLTRIKFLFVVVALLFQPLKGINGRTDTDVD